MNSFYELATHMIASNHMSATMSILVNQTIWDSIDPADQAIIRAAYDEIMSQCNEDVNGEAETFKQQLINEYGCDLYEYTDAEQAELVARFTDYWAENAKANDYEDLLQ